VVGGSIWLLAVETEILGSEVGTEDPIINSGAIGEEGGFGNIPKGRSIAHNKFDNQNAVFLSFDIETTGEIAGIVQISAEIVCLRSIRQRRRFLVLTMPATYYERKTPSTGTLTRRFVLYTVISTVYLCTTHPVQVRLGLSSPRNTTSSGSPAGKINILGLKEDPLLARHSSSLTLCAQQKA